MQIFYKRIETPGEIIIIYKYNLHFWVSFVVLMVAGMILDISILYFVAAGLTLIYMVDILLPGIEVNRAMRKGKVQMSGNKFSPNNPLKIVISK